MPIFLVEQAKADMMKPVRIFPLIYRFHMGEDQLLELSRKFRQNTAHLRSLRQCLEWNPHLDLYLAPEIDKEKSEK